MIFGNQKSVIVLIDPDKVTESDLDLLLSYDNVPFCWFVGGSLLFEEKFESTITYLKQRSKNPVIIFPGNNLHSLVPNHNSYPLSFLTD